MNKWLKYTHAHVPLSPAIGPAAANPRRSFPTPAKFPRRPNLTVLSEAIPLFYIGQNRHGFWVARDAEARNGGLFLRKESALRFAREKSKPGGCATMFLTEPVDLGIENQGSRFVEPITAFMDAAARRAPAVVAIFGVIATEWRKLVAEISHAFAGQRRNREAIERELFHGKYRLSSKDGDDLPVP